MSLLGFIGLGIMAKNALTPKWSVSKGAAEYRKRHPLIRPVAGTLYGDYSDIYKPYQFTFTKIPVSKHNIPDGIYTITMPDGRRVTREYKYMYDDKKYDDESSNHFIRYTNDQGVPMCAYREFNRQRCREIILNLNGKEKKEALRRNYITQRENIYTNPKGGCVIRDRNCKNVIWEDIWERDLIQNLGVKYEARIRSAKEKIKMYEKYDRECDLDKIVKLEKVIKDNKAILNNQKNYIEETKMFIQYFENCTFDMYRKFNDLECWDAFLTQITANSRNTKHRVSKEEKQIVWEELKKDIVKDELRVNENETRKFLKHEYEKMSVAINTANTVLWKYRLSMHREDARISLDDLREFYEKEMRKYTKLSSLGWW